MLLYNTPPNSKELYEEFKEHMLTRPNPNRENDLEIREQRLLRKISRILRGANRSNTDFNLPEPDEAEALDIEEEIEIYYDPFLEDLTGDELDEQHKEERHKDIAERVGKLNKEQKEFIDLIESTFDQIRSKSGDPQRLHFLHGSGGFGKTYTYNTLIDHLKEKKGLKALACATTGIASTYLQNKYHRATTMHSLFRLPLKLKPNSTANVDQNSFAGHLLSGADVIIIDEIGIADVRYLHVIDKLLKDLAPQNSPESKMIFGGKIVIFGGDPKQQFPIVSGGNMDSQAAVSFFKSDWVKLFQQFKLIQSMRLAPGQELYSNWITELGEGRNFIPGTDRIHLLDDNMAVYNEEDLIKKVFPPEILADPKACTKRTILCPHNLTANRINEKVSNMLPEDIVTKVYYSVDKSKKSDPLDIYASEQDEINLNSISKGTIPEHKMTLKVGSPVMLLRNLSVENGLCNGTIMRVEALGDTIIWCRKQDGSIEPIQKITFDEDQDDVGGVSFTRYQFPLRLAYAITITKSQGGTYDFVGAHLTQECFSHGQAYTLFSRVTSQDGIFVLAREPEVGERPTIRNVVYEHFVQKRQEIENNQSADPDDVVELSDDEDEYEDLL